MSDSTPTKSPVLDALPERFSEPTPIAPDAATWGALTPAQKEEKLWEIIDALPFSEVMSEGTPHSDAKMAVIESLRRFYGHRRRSVFIAPELTVMYPGERTFVPDVLVVCDVELKPRNAWVVLDEGRGPDLILEIRNKGRRAKDYRLNVDRFARLGIREYFVYDVLRQEVAGFHLESPDTQRYVPIMPQGGRYRAEVLDLDLAIVDGRLRFYFSGAELPDAATEVDFLTRMVEDRSNRLEDAERRAQIEAERAETETVRAQAETVRAQAESERAQIESERAQAESERADRALAALRAAIRALFVSRGWTLSETATARLEETVDPDVLAMLLARAATASKEGGLFED